MATLLFAAAGSAIGGAIGGSILGVSAAAIGQAVGGVIGRAVDQALFGPTQIIEGPRVDNLDVTTATEGDGLIRIDGHARVAGTLIWATRLEEIVNAQKVGGKGGGPSGTQITYTYRANFAVAVCAGTVAHFGRIWADGKLLDTSDLTIRTYTGSETQSPDPLIVANEGAAPAYRGVAYIVFENMDVTDYGSRIPNIELEVWGESGKMESLIQGVDVIPGTTEFGYSPTLVSKLGENFSFIPENARREGTESDWKTSLDFMQGVLPNVSTVALVVAWFGTDLRVSHCKIEPRVENKEKFSIPAWSAGGFNRLTANLVSQVDGRPAFGSAPDDVSVMDAIKDLRSRGHRVVLYPFIMMDIPADNTLPDPDTGTEGQPIYPWRGRIRKDALGASAASQVSDFMGSATPSEFPGQSIYESTWIGVSASLGDESTNSTITWTSGAPFVGIGSQVGIKTVDTSEVFTVTVQWITTQPQSTTVTWVLEEKTVAWDTQAVMVDQNPTGAPVYTGTDQGTYRRFILHLAALARNAGGVDAFLVGTEMVGLTKTTDGAGAYPFVDALVSLAADVKTMLPSTAVSYAADWSEFNNHVDGNDVYFHLDPLWSSPDVDFVGIDNYLPLSDWRHGQNHLDYDPDAGVTSIYNLDYLKANIEGGENWDWFYASDQDRRDQVRTPITDGAYGEPWIYRQKAIRDWHGNAHHNRPGGVRDTSPTNWVPSSKPVWFTELGCPAVEMASNQPNVFYDPKSSESFLPYFSSGRRDDFIQRQFIRASIEWWTDNGAGIVDPADILIWAWDARPWPEFPRLTNFWTDGPNARFGHWLNGRAGSAPAAEVLERALINDYGLAPEDINLTACYGQADGIVLPNPLSFRELLAPWETALRLDAVDIGGVIHIKSRSAAIKTVDLVPEDLVEVGQSEPYEITREALEEAPRSALVYYIDAEKDYERVPARASIRDRSGEAEAVADLVLVSDQDRMTGVAEVMLRDAVEARESVEFTLPPSTDLRPGHVFGFTPENGRPLTFMAEEMTRGTARRVRAKQYATAIYTAAGGPSRPSPAILGQASKTMEAIFLDLPVLPGLEMEVHQGLVALAAQPWPGGADLHRSLDLDTGYAFNLRTGIPPQIGETVTDLKPGTVGFFNENTVDVRMVSGTLISVSKDDVLNGANTLAIEHDQGEWEILQFRDATLVDAKTWRLKGLLRGQLGTEHVRNEAADLVSGARVVVLDSGLNAVEMLTTDVGTEFWWRAVPSGGDIAGDLVVPKPHAFRGIGMRPYSPVHLKAALSGTSLTVDWIRRSRVDGDPWSSLDDIPLGEAFERYVVEVGPEGAPLVQATVNDTTSATLDVTGITWPQEIRVSQVSETFGPGVPGRLTATF